eukprot:4146361-Prymnesium_polylepis.2
MLREVTGVAQESMPGLPTQETLAHEALPVNVLVATGGIFPTRTATRIVYLSATPLATPFAKASGMLMATWYI